MNAPRKAVVLCAGLGTRLRPLTAFCPKPLLPLWGEPLLDYTLDLLARWGVQAAYLNLHHAPARLRAYAAARGDRLPTLTLGYERTILGTGGTLRRAAAFLGGEPFWMVNGDIAADLEPDPLLAAFAARRALAALWLDATQGPRTVETGPEGDIATFRSAAPGTPGTCTFCGLQLLDPAILRYIPRGFSSIVSAYERAQADGHGVLGVTVPGAFWADLGTPEGYLGVHRAALAAALSGLPGGRFCPPAARARQTALGLAGVTVRGFAAVAPGVRLPAGVMVEDSVLGQGVRASRGARFRQAIVADGLRLGGAVEGLAVRGDRADDTVVNLALDHLGWHGRTTAIQPLPARGSARRFVRLHHGRATLLLMHYSAERAENALFAGHTRFLAGLGLRVPALVADLAPEPVLLLEDLGTRDLLAQVTAEPAAARQLYRRVLHAVALLHARGRPAAEAAGLKLCAPFDANLYRWEHDLFEEHFLCNHLRLEPARRRPILDVLRRAADRLLPLPAVLLHRDLQSTNVILTRSAPAFIDYQGLRLGPAAYDLASLLADPYVSLPEPIQLALLRDHARANAIDPAELEEHFWWAAVQRLAQALGAYGRLRAQPATAHFARHIAPGLAMLRRAAQHCNILSPLGRLVCYG